MSANLTMTDLPVALGVCRLAARLPAAEQVPAAGGWRDLALCRDDPEGWFPHDSDKAGIATAKALCRRCPACVECADWVLNARPKITHGVAGALSEADRARIWRAQDRQATRGRGAS